MFSGDRRMAALTFAVYNLFVGQHGIAMRAPVDRCRGTIGQSLFIELQKTPLCPFIIFGHAGFDFVIPIKGSAHCFQLMLHGIDVGNGRILGMNARLDGIVLGR